MRTFLFTLIALLDILLIIMGHKKNNPTLKIVGYLLLLPVSFTVVSLVYGVFIA